MDTMIFRMRWTVVTTVLGIGCAVVQSQAADAIHGPVVQPNPQVDQAGFVPRFQQSDDESVAPPAHPPIDQIAAMPMPEPDEASTPFSPTTLYEHDATTGETTELPPIVGTGLSVEDKMGGFRGLEGPLSGDEFTESFGNMVTVGPATSWPRRGNAKLVMRFQDGTSTDHFFVCSGTMADAGVVLTAAHCVYARDPDGVSIYDWAEEIWVYPGWDGVGAVWGGPATDDVIEHWGWVRGTHYIAGSGYVDDGDQDRDCGLVRLGDSNPVDDCERSVGMLTGWFPWASGGSCTDIKDRTYYNYSYPNECCNAGCTLHTGRDLYYWSGHFDSCPGNQLQIDTSGGCYNAGWGGMSGSGAYYTSGGSHYVHAVCSNSDRSSRARYCMLWEQFANDMEDFESATRTTTFDLEAMMFRVEGNPGTADAGHTLPQCTVIVANATNANPAADSYTLTVRLSENNNLSASDTLLATWSYDVDFGAMHDMTFAMPGPTIPPDTPPGDYWLGVVINAGTDVNDCNNDTDTWDATPITVTCPTVAAPAALSASDGIYTDKVLVAWAPSINADEYRVYRCTGVATATCASVSGWQADLSYDDTMAPVGTLSYYRVKARTLCGTESGYSTYNTGWRSDTCNTVPDYHYTIAPVLDWTTTSARSFGMGGCHLYRMYLYHGKQYDFSLCDGDGSGGWAFDGDADLTMYDNAGTQKWTIDGTAECSDDASTMGTLYESWSPQTDGWYYLKLSGDLRGAVEYGLAYRGVCECRMPPAYNAHLIVSELWQTAPSVDLCPGTGSCYRYRMYLDADWDYDFSVCSDDGVGGTTMGGDGDFTTLNATGVEQWYIDGDVRCGMDASTLETEFEGWSPPVSGIYYLGVSAYSGGTLNFTLAYRGVCPLPAVPKNVSATDGEWTDFVKITWDDVAGADDYHAYRDGMPLGPWGPDTGYTDFTAVPGRRYDYQVRARGTCGEGTLSAVNIGWRADDCNDNDLPDQDEPDEDADGTIDDCDNCWKTPNKYQEDGDDDGVGDACDLCPNTIPGSPVDEKGCPPLIPGDFDRDGDVDVSDYEVLAGCASGPEMNHDGSQSCRRADFDADKDIDQADFAVFQRCISGEDTPGDPTCNDD